MSIPFRSFAELDPADVQQHIDEIIARVREDNESLYLKQGPLFGVLGYYHALLATRTDAQLKDYLDARSLQTMIDNPASALPELVDEAASNFRISRKLGTAAIGTVTILVSDDISVVIGAETEFIAEGKSYFTEQVYTAKLEEEQVVSSGDRLLTQQADGNWAFTIEVVAERTGVEYEIKKDTIITPTTLPNNYVASYAASDFVGGLSDQTNEELLARCESGASAKTIGNRVNNLAMLLEVTAFSRIIGMNIIGLGNAELTRDRPTIFPVKLGGRTDWYVRTQEECLNETLSFEASLIEKQSDGTGIWQATFNREDSAGAFEIVEIKPYDSEDFGGFEVLETVRSVDVTGDGFKPDVPSGEHAAFSSYQTLTVRFHDDQTVVTDLDLLATAQYIGVRRRMPLIAEIQEHVNQYDVRYTGADCLVKAPIPCFVTIHLTISKQSGTSDPDTSSIKSALVRTINQIGFTGRLYASQLHDAVHGYLEASMGVSALDLRGRLLYPDGAFRYISGADALVIEPDEERMVSPRTVQFFASEADISIVVEANVPLNL